VVTVHWGVQGATCQSEDQRTLAGRLLDAGADVIAGHHSHRVQSLEQRRRGVVGCSLGNFLWYPTDDAARRSAVLQAELGREGRDHGTDHPGVHRRPRPPPAG
jgi:poly-gamma-glutamate synthesis protein (capsule biosynthesis protein)